MKKSSLLLALIGLAFMATAQVETNKFSGDWDMSTSNVVRFVNGKVQLFYKEDKSNKLISAKERFEKDKPGYFSETSDINRNNAVYSWTNSCKTCKWTETHIYHFSYVSEFIIKVHFTRIVNNIDVCEIPEESWSTSSKKSFKEVDDYVIGPRVVWEKASPTVGAGSNRDISILNIANFSKYTEIKFQIYNQGEARSGYQLHSPGSDKAFVITDNNGVKYKLVGQYGFGGFDQPITIGSESKKIFYCYFEKIPSNTKVINIKEGDCNGSNCWNFYEVMLQ